MISEQNQIAQMYQFQENGLSPTLKKLTPEFLADIRQLVLNKGTVDRGTVRLICIEDWDPSVKVLVSVAEKLENRNIIVIDNSDGSLGTGPDGYHIIPFVHIDSLPEAFIFWDRRVAVHTDELQNRYFCKTKQLPSLSRRAEIAETIFAKYGATTETILNGTIIPGIISRMQEEMQTVIASDPRTNLP